MHVGFRILAGFVHAASPDSIVESFRNAGISSILDNNRVIRFDITPNTARSIIGTPFADPQRNLVTEEEEDEEEDPKVEILEVQILDLWESGGESGNGE
jgi:hypothetical protein